MITRALTRLASLPRHSHRLAPPARRVASGLLYALGRPIPRDAAEDMALDIRVHSGWFPFAIATLGDAQHRAAEVYANAEALDPYLTGCLVVAAQRVGWDMGDHEADVEDDAVERAAALARRDGVKLVEREDV